MGGFYVQALEVPSSYSVIKDTFRNPVWKSFLVRFLKSNNGDDPSTIIKDAVTKIPCRHFCSSFLSS